METLTIFYDPHCGLCQKFRVWLEAQPKRVVVDFLGYDTPEASMRFPGLLEIGADRDVVVLADDGRWWQGCSAWLTCLWTTFRYQEWSYRLATPALQPFVKKAVHLLSENRLTLSQLVGRKTDRSIQEVIETQLRPSCADGACEF